LPRIRRDRAATAKNPDRARYSRFMRGQAAIM
jgi:hypothetical protein